MPISKTFKAQISLELDKFCEARIPLHARDKVRISFRWVGSKVTIFEHRPLFLEPDKWTEISVAQFRFNQDSSDWSLYCSDRNSRWHPYLESPSRGTISDLLAEVNDDPTGIFWG
jgi:hypothetical protein